MSNSILLVGTAVTRPGATGTLYRSENGGPWCPAEGMPLDTGVQALTPHPQKPGTVFAATREGVYRSTDHGMTWQKLAVPGRNEEFWSVAIHPRKPEVVFAGASPVGVYRSDDTGASWRRVGSADPMPELCEMLPKTPASRLMRICFDPADPSRMFGACETNGLIVSDDGGESWRDASETLISISESDALLRSKIVTGSTFEGIIDGHAVCVSARKPGVVYYACRMGVFSTDDNGRTWHDHEVGRFAPFSYSRDLRIAVDDPATFYLALSIGARSNSGAYYRSKDFGATWARVDEGITAQSTIMSTNLHATDPRRMIYLTRGGQIVYTEDQCHSWLERQLPSDAGDGFCAAIL